MSVREDLLDAIRALPLAEQRALLIELIVALNRDTRGVTRRVPVSVSEVRGIADSGAQPPTDEQIADGYADYLIEKYS